MAAISVRDLDDGHQGPGPGQDDMIPSLGAMLTR